MLGLTLAVTISCIVGATLSGTSSGSCNLFKTCSSCTSGLPTFNCSWCDSISKCSDGQDRHRQVWLANQCDRAENLLVDQLQCPSSSVPTEVSPTEAQTAPPLRASNPPSQTSNSPMQTRSFKQTPSSKQDLVRKSTPSKPGQSPPSTAEMLTTEQLLTTNEATDQYCANIKCLNGGSCVNGFCLCPPRNEGSRCQKYVVKQCKGIHCLNGGTCQEGITLHICDCKRGYSGKYCDVVNSSARSTGSNGATLTVGAIVCIVLIAVLVGGLLVWVVYAYRHPNSSSGLFIIEAKHKIKRQGRGSNGVQCKYHQQVDTNHIDIQL